MANFYKLKHGTVFRRGRYTDYPIGNVKPLNDGQYEATAFPCLHIKRNFKTKYAALKHVVSSYCVWVGIGLREYL